MTALLLSLMALPSGASAAVPSTGSGTAQQLAQQITGAVLRQTPTAASIEHAVRTAMAADNVRVPMQATAMTGAGARSAAALVAAARAAPVVRVPPPPPSPMASAAHTRVSASHVGTRRAPLHARGRPHGHLGAHHAARAHRRGRATSLRHAGTSSIRAAGPEATSLYWPLALNPVPDPTPSSLMIGDQFLLTLVGLAGDTGLLQTIAGAGGHTLSDLAGQIVADTAAPIPAAAASPAQGTAGPVARRPPRHPVAARRAQWLPASWHVSERPSVRAVSSPQPVSFVGHPRLVRAALGAPRSRGRSHSARPDRPAAPREPTTQLVEAIGLAGLTLFAGGPAVGGAGGIASGAAAVVLTALFLLHILGLLSGRLSLELVPWRSALMTLRLERPG